jgi:hypothetical protein
MGDLERLTMRAFLLACLAIVVVGAGGYFFLSALQEPTGIAYATDSARINVDWAWRSVFNPGSANESAMKSAQGEACDKRKTWQWIFVDLGKPDGESAICSDSQ